jgi:choline kinase
MNPMDGVSKGSIGEFLLDSRTPGGSSLDLGAAALYDYKEEEAQRERETERQVNELLKETHIWRVANSAQWVAWGIVQAKVPELDESVTPTTLSGAELVEEPAAIEMNDKGNLHPNGHLVANGSVTSIDLEKRPEGSKAEALISGDHGGNGIKELEALDGEEGEAEFDYLAYAQDRAMFFWGDMVTLGLVTREELPEKLVRRLKVVEY